MQLHCSWPGLRREEGKSKRRSQGGGGATVALFRQSGSPVPCETNYGLQKDCRITPSEKKKEGD